MTRSMYQGYIGSSVGASREEWRVIGPASYDPDTFLVDVTRKMAPGSYETLREEWGRGAVERMVRQGQLRRPL